MPTDYIINQRKLEDWCKKNIDADIVVVFCGRMTNTSNAQSYLKNCTTCETIHIRMSSICKDMYNFVLAKNFLKNAREKAFFRMFDYWEICDWPKIVGRPV